MKIVPKVIFHEGAGLVVNFGVPPAARCVVVVGARIYDAVTRVIVRQEWIGRVTEGEMQNLHPGQAEVVAQLLDTGRDHAQGLRR